jgi:Peptidase family M1 domain
MFAAPGVEQPVSATAAKPTHPYFNVDARRFLCHHFTSPIILFIPLKQRIWQIIAITLLYFALPSGWALPAFAPTQLEAHASSPSTVVDSGVVGTPRTGDAFPPTATPVAPPTYVTVTPVPRPAGVDIRSYDGALRSGFVGDLRAFGEASVYDIALVVDLDTLTVFGEQRVLYTNRGPALSEIALRLYPNTEHYSGSMRLVRATADDVPVPIVVDPDASVQRLRLPQPLETGERVLIQLGYQIDVPQDPRTPYAVFGLTEGILSLPSAYALIPPRDPNGDWRTDRTVAFGDVVYAESALYRVTVRVPAGVVMVSTGVCEEASEGPQTRYDCVAAPVRDFSITLSRQFRVAEAVLSSPFGEPIMVRSFYAPDRERAGQRMLSVGADALAFFEQRYGAYPYKVLNLFQTTTPIGGIEYPMMVGVTPIIDIDERFFDWLVAHEVAHQWWYGMVGSDPINEAWLDESLAQYVTGVYVNAAAGPGEGSRSRSRFFAERWRAELQIRGDATVSQPTGAFARSAYFPIVYGKGPLFYEQLRAELGEEAVDIWLRRYFTANRYGMVTATDLLRAADESEIGAEVRRVFAQWITSAGAAPTPQP